MHPRYAPEVASGGRVAEWLRLPYVVALQCSRERFESL